VVHQSALHGGDDAVDVNPRRRGIAVAFRWFVVPAWRIGPMAGLAALGGGVLFLRDSPAVGGLGGSIHARVCLPHDGGHSAT
jgi:hypothetical protein